MGYRLTLPSPGSDLQSSKHRLHNSHGEFIRSYQEFIAFPLSNICKVYAYECYINSYLDLIIMHKILGTCKYAKNFRNTQILKLLVPSIFGLYLLDWKKLCMTISALYPKVQILLLDFAWDLS